MLRLFLLMVGATAEGAGTAGAGTTEWAGKTTWSAYSSNDTNCSGATAVDMAPFDEVKVVVLHESDTFCVTEVENETTVYNKIGYACGAGWDGLIFNSSNCSDSTCTNCDLASAARVSYASHRPTEANTICLKFALADPVDAGSIAGYEGAFTAIFNMGGVGDAVEEIQFVIDNSCIANAPEYKALSSTSATTTAAATPPPTTLPSPKAAPSPPLTFPTTTTGTNCDLECLRNRGLVDDDDEEEDHETAEVSG